MRALLLAVTLIAWTSAAIGDAPPVRVTVEKLIRDSLHSWETGDVELFKSTVTADLTFAYPGGKTDLAGALAMFDFWRTHYENTRVYFHRILVDGAHYAAEYQFATTRKENGKRTVVGTLMTGTVRDGRLAVIKEYLDGRVSRLQEAGELPLGPENAEPFPWPVAGGSASSASEDASGTSPPPAQKSVAAESAAASTAIPPFPPPPESIPGGRRITYKSAGGRALPMYIFGAPEARRNRRSRGAVLFFHGSGWQSGTVLQFVDLARRLASQGLVTAVVEYRVREVYGASPFDAVADAKSAIRWMRIHAASLGVDARKIAAIGASSGGHIALAAAVFANDFDDPGDDRAVSARPDALVLFAPVVDTTEQGYPAGVPLFKGREHDLSPLHHLHTGLPPVLIFQGTADQSVRSSGAEAFARRCAELHERCTLRLFPGRDHHFYNSPDYFRLRSHLPGAFSSEDYNHIVTEVARFLRTNGMK
jgi:acetyl esterase